jgi:hypothetical protein
MTTFKLTGCFKAFLLLGMMWLSTEAKATNSATSFIDTIVVISSFTNPAPVINGADPFFANRKKIYLFGNFERITFRNLVGTAVSPITITTLGTVTIGSEVGFNHSFTITNCAYLNISGEPFLDNGTERLLQITNAPVNHFAMLVSGQSHHIDIHHLDVQNPTGFAGITVKNSPDGDPAMYQDDQCDDPGISHIRIHHNRIHNTGTKGEGIYVGDSFFLGRGDGNTAEYPNAYCPPFRYPQAITHVEIDNNVLENIAWDGIQIGSAIAGSSVHDNVITNYGIAGANSQANGIQVGEGCQGLSCYNNFIANEVSTTQGHGIICLGAGNNTFYNNIIIDPPEAGFYVKEVANYRAYGLQQPGAYYELCDLLDYSAVGSVFLHNTIIRPGTFGIQLFRGSLYGNIACTDETGPNDEITTTLPGGYAVNNLIINASYLPEYNGVGPTTGPLSAQTIFQQTLEEIKLTNLVIFTETEDPGIAAGSSLTDIFVAPALNNFMLQDAFVPTTPIYAAAGDLLKEDYHAQLRQGERVDFGAIERPAPLIPDAIVAASEKTPALLKVHPNPTLNYTDLRFELPEAGRCMISVVDATGRMVFNAQPFLEGESIQYRIPAEALKQKGIYRVQVISPKGNRQCATILKM